MRSPNRAKEAGIPNKDADGINEVVGKFTFNSTISQDIGTSQEHTVDFEVGLFK
jgi:hypothetical protein